MIHPSEARVETEARKRAEILAARLLKRSQLAHGLHDIVAHHMGAMTIRASSGRLAVDTSGGVAVAAAALGILTAGPTDEGGWTVAVALPAPPALSAPAGPAHAARAERGAA